MLLQTNSYIVPKERRSEHARLIRRFRQALARIGCDQFEVYEQVGPNWTPDGANGRYVQIMRFRDRHHQKSVQAAERVDPGAQHIIAEFCELINFPYQQQHGYFATGFYTSSLPVGPRQVSPQPVEESTEALAPAPASEETPGYESDGAEEWAPAEATEDADEPIAEAPAAHDESEALFADEPAAIASVAAGRAPHDGAEAQAADEFVDALESEQMPAEDLAGGEEAAPPAHETAAQAGSFAQEPIAEPIEEAVDEFITAEAFRPHKDEPTSLTSDAGFGLAEEPALAEGELGGLDFDEPELTTPHPAPAAESHAAQDDVLEPLGLEFDRHHEATPLESPEHEALFEPLGLEFDEPENAEPLAAAGHESAFEPLSFDFKETETPGALPTGEHEPALEPMGLDFDEFDELAPTAEAEDKQTLAAAPPELAEAEAPAPMAPAEDETELEPLGLEFDDLEELTPHLDGVGEEAPVAALQEPAEPAAMAPMAAALPPMAPALEPTAAPGEEPAIEPLGLDFDESGRPKPIATADEEGALESLGLEFDEFEELTRTADPEHKGPPAGAPQEPAEADASAPLIASEHEQELEPLGLDFDDSEFSKPAPTAAGQEDSLEPLGLDFDELHELTPTTDAGHNEAPGAAATESAEIGATAPMATPDHEQALEPLGLDFDESEHPKPVSTAGQEGALEPLGLDFDELEELTQTPGAQHNESLATAPLDWAEVEGAAPEHELEPVELDGLEKEATTPIPTAEDEHAFEPLELEPDEIEGLKPLAAVEPTEQAPEPAGLAFEAPGLSQPEAPASSTPTEELEPPGLEFDDPSIGDAAAAHDEGHATSAPGTRRMFTDAPLAESGPFDTAHPEPVNEAAVPPDYMQAPPPSDSSRTHTDAPLAESDPFELAFEEPQLAGSPAPADANLPHDHEEAALIFDDPELSMPAAADTVDHAAAASTAVERAAPELETASASHEQGLPFEDDLLATEDDHAAPAPLPMGDVPHTHPPQEDEFQLDEGLIFDDDEPASASLAGVDIDLPGAQDRPAGRAPHMPAPRASHHDNDDDLAHLDLAPLDDDADFAGLLDDTNMLANAPVTRNGNAGREPHDAHPSLDPHEDDDQAQHDADLLAFQDFLRQMEQEENQKQKR